MSFDLDGYVDVAERIGIFRAKHPEGSLQPVDPTRPFTIETIGDRVFVVYAAAAYRTPDDLRPGVGVAWEPFPGKTPYTRDSEVMVAETSAWGRAIVAALAADTKKVASTEELQARGGGGAEPGTMPSTPSKNVARTPANSGPAVDGAQTTSSGPRPATPKQRFALNQLIEVHGPPDGLVWPLEDDLTFRDASQALTILKKLPDPPPNIRVATLRAGGSGQPDHPGADDGSAESLSAAPDSPAPTLTDNGLADLPDLSEYDGSPF
jgi:hypothetical protein